MKRQVFQLFLLFLLAFSPMGSHCQQVSCGCIVTPDIVAREMQNLQSPLRVPDGKMRKTFNVHAWIVVDSFGFLPATPANVNNLLAQLTDVFTPLDARFQVCKIDTIQDWDYSYYMSGIHQPKVEVLYYQPEVINMYFVRNLIEVNDNGGYAVFPGGPDIIVIEGPPSLRVAAHQMGHFFGLYDTFERAFGVEAVDRSNCNSTGDLICDTEADPNGVVDPPLSCNYVSPERDAQGGFYVPPLDNFMSYYNCACKYTVDQYSRMHAQWLTLRNYLR